jgi:hypothetical protein
MIVKSGASCTTLIFLYPWMQNPIDRIDFILNHSGYFHHEWIT